MSLTHQKSDEDKEEITIRRYHDQLSFIRNDYEFLTLSLMDDGSLEINVWPGDFYGVCEFLNKDCVASVLQFLQTDDTTLETNDRSYYHKE